MQLRPLRLRQENCAASVAIAVYANSLGGALVYDDVNAITNNAVVLDGDVRGILTTASWWGVVAALGCLVLLQLLEGVAWRRLPR